METHFFPFSEPACQEVTKLVEEEVEEEVCNTIEEEVFFPFLVYIFFSFQFSSLF